MIFVASPSVRGNEQVVTAIDSVLETDHDQIFEAATGKTLRESDGEWAAVAGHRAVSHPP
jgi:hypothetical protein